MIEIFLHGTVVKQDIIWRHLLSNTQRSAMVCKLYYCKSNILKFKFQECEDLRQNLHQCFAGKLPHQIILQKTKILHEDRFLPFLTKYQIIFPIKKYTGNCMISSKCNTNHDYEKVPGSLWHVKFYPFLFFSQSSLDIYPPKSAIQNTEKILLSIFVCSKQQNIHQKRRSLENEQKTSVLSTHFAKNSKCCCFSEKNRADHKGVEKGADFQPRSA